MRDRLLTEILSLRLQEHSAGEGGTLASLRQGGKQAFVLDVVSVYV